VPWLIAETDVRSVSDSHPSCNDDYVHVASMVLLMHIAAYFVNVFGMFLSRLSLYSLLCIFSFLSIVCHLHYTQTLYCVN